MIVLAAPQTFNIAPRGASTVEPSTPSVPVPTPQSTNSQSVNVTSGFEGIYYYNGTTSIPPDPQVASNQNYLLEAVNSVATVWKKDGTQVLSFSLYGFFNVSLADDVTDPRVLYDNSSGRWFLSAAHLECQPYGFGCSVSGGLVVLAVSKTSDPTGDWWKYSFRRTGSYPDYPAIGVSDDKFVVSANDIATAPGDYSGAQYWIFNKSLLINGTDVHASRDEGAGITYIHPVQSLSASSTLYMVENLGSSIRLFSITGLPPDGVALLHVDLPVSNIQPIDRAPQKGTSLNVELDGFMVLDAKWFQGKLWLSLHDGCVPAGDNQTRSCLRMIELDTNKQSVIQDFDYGAAGKYYFYPALSFDGLGNLVVVFGYSSTVDYPGLMATSQLSSDPQRTLEQPILLLEGSDPETWVCSNGACRYGDYFGASPDPADPTVVWVVGEFDELSNQGFWSTWVAGVSADVGFDFSMSNSGGISVGQGGVGSNTITVDLMGGTTLPVALNITGLPSGSGSSFSGGCSGTPSCTAAPPFSTTLTIQTTSSTHCGSFAITVKGTVGDLTHTTSFTLRVCSSHVDYDLSWLGYDWDGGGEETLALNSKFLASLPTTDSPQNAGTWAAFSLNITSLIVQGVNTLTFTHANFDCSTSDNVENLQVTNGTIVYSNSTVQPLSCGQSLTYSFRIVIPSPSVGGSLVPINKLILIVQYVIPSLAGVTLIILTRLFIERSKDRKYARRANISSAPS